MIGKEFDAISRADIEALVATPVAESRTIEYKERLPASANSDKKEFLSDVSSFANADGGDLIYGIRDKREAGKATGIPEAIVGLPGINVDLELRRLEQVLQSHIDPRIPGIKMKAIEGFASGRVIVIRVPKSWAFPHMVAFEKQSPFYSRTSAGKYQLDMREIRNACDMSATLKSRVEVFRTDRLTKIERGETPLPLALCPHCVLHFYPLRPSGRAGMEDLTIPATKIASIQPFHDPVSRERFNFDGFLSFPASGQTKRAYVQVFRYGPIESVFSCKFLDFSQSLCSEEEKAAKRHKVLDAISLEGMARHGLHHFLTVYKQMNVEPPFVFMMSLVRVKGLEIGTDNRWRDFDETTPFESDILPLPELIIDTFDILPDPILKPVFDVVWQATNNRGSKNYDQMDRWTPYPNL